MQISYLWLKELTGVDWSAKEVADRLTLCGIAAEEIIPTAKYLEKVVVGKVEDLAAVEGASKIRKAIVNIGDQHLEVICGAPNVEVGQKVPVAMIGAKVAGDMEVKKAKIRGIESAGMICSESELGISTDHSGIMVLAADAPVGAPVRDYLEFDDYILGFELTPNRGDAWSAIGIARDLAALAGVKVRRPEIKLKEVSEQASAVIKVSIEDTVGCPRYAARVIRNVKIGPSPWWIKKKLLTAGVRPISNVVDITNLVMLECGNPLHAFDLNRFGGTSHILPHRGDEGRLVYNPAGKQVVIRRANQGEKFVTLDGQERTLSSQVLMITNGTESVAVAGVMGGQSSEVEDSTTNILLEAAYFDPIVVRRGRRELGLITDASARFERGVDPNNIDYAINRASALFHEVCGGEVLQGIVDCYPKRILPKSVSLRPSRCSEIVGVDLSAKRMREILSGLEFQVTEDNPIQATVPTFRSDISTEIDLIEEIARIHGWQNIPDSVENIGPLYSPANRDDQYENEIRRILTGAGFDEVLGHGLGDGRVASKLHPNLPQVKITNPVSDELSIMRNSMLESMMGIASHNFSHRNTDLRLFELGRVYFPPRDGEDFRELERLSVAVTGNTPSNWRDKTRAFDFYDLKVALNVLAGHFHWQPLSFEPTQREYLDADISFEVWSGMAKLGVMGKVTDTLSKQFDIRQDVYFGEFDLHTMMLLSHELGQFTPLPVYPAAPRDLAIVVDQPVRVGDMVERIRQVAGALAETVTVFDVYAGKQIAAGKKSVGISVVYRSNERSLSSEEVDKMQQDIIGALKDEFKADIREK